MSTLLSGSFTPSVKELLVVPHIDALISVVPLLTPEQRPLGFITAAFAFAWLVTLFMTFIMWRKVKNIGGQAGTSNSAQSLPSKKQLSKAMDELKQACNTNNPTAAKQAVLGWALAAWPNNAPRSLEATAIRLHDSSIKQAFSELSQVLYAYGNESWNGAAFWDMVSARMRLPNNSQNTKDKSLPGLYPQGS